MEYMQYDREIVLNILDRVYDSIEQIEKFFFVLSFFICILAAE